MNASAGVTQEEGPHGSHCFSTFLLRCFALTFLSREIFSRSFPTSTVKSNFVYPRHKSFSTCWASCERTHTSQRQKVSRLPTETTGVTGLLRLVLFIQKKYCRRSSREIDPPTVVTQAVTRCLWSRWLIPVP